MASAMTVEPDFLPSAVRIPDHVVHRAFVNETVVLNLHTGRYHGLNGTGGRILELLVETASPTETVARLVAESGRHADEIRRDVVAFCTDLLSRGLIERAPSGG
jgi:hypothetical protein